MSSIDPSDFCEDFAFVPITSVHKSAFNVKDLKRKFESFRRGVFTEVANLEEVSEAIIQGIIDKNVVEHYGPMLEEMTAPKKKPKREQAPSAYLLFSNAIHEEILRENPGISFKDTGAKKGEKWHAMTEEEKKPYFEQSAGIKAAMENGTYVKPEPKKSKSKATKEVERSPSVESTASVAKEEPKKEEKKTEKKEKVEKKEKAAPATEEKAEKVAAPKKTKK